MLKKLNSLEGKEAATAYAFILPFTLGFIFFSIIPFISVIVMSMTDYTIYVKLKDMKFVFFDNFIRLAQDKEALGSMLRSVYYVVLYVPMVMCVSLLFAVLLNTKLYLRNLARTMIFMPYISNLVAVAMVWFVLLNPFEGPINTFLVHIGFENPPMWLASTVIAMPTVVCIIVWQNMGFHMVAFLAAIQTIPNDLYEAITIDGGNRWQKFRYITLPGISNTAFFLMTTSIIGAFQNFAPINVLTGGGPGYTTRVFAVNLYEEAFSKYDFSYAAAQAVGMFAIIMIITVIQWRGQEKWVTNF